MRPIRIAGTRSTVHASWRMGITLILFVFLTGCREVPDIFDLLGEIPPNPTWTETSHGRVLPNYGVVFPQERVNRIEVILPPGGWDLVQEDVSSLLGFDFGERKHGVFSRENPLYIPATVRFNEREWTGIGFRLKGLSSLYNAWYQGSYKLPFRLDFDYFSYLFPEIQDQHLYGFGEFMMAPAWNDPSLIRDKVMADIFRWAGIPATRTAFYQVHIDFGEGLRYVGVYTLVEVIEDTMIRDQFEDDSGNLYKPTSHFQSFSKSDFEKQNNTTSSDWSDVQKAISALNSSLRNTDRAQWRTELEATFNVDHFIRWLAINNTTVNWGAYGIHPHNYYLYAHPTDKLTWIPWYHNDALKGSPGITQETGDSGGGIIDVGLSLSMNEVTDAWPLIRYLIDDPVYSERYRAHMRTFVDDVFTTERMEALFEKYHVMVAPFAVGPNGERPDASYLPDPAAFTTSLDELRRHVRDRREIVERFLDGE